MVRLPPVVFALIVPIALGACQKGGNRAGAAESSAPTQSEESLSPGGPPPEEAPELVPLVRIRPDYPPQARAEGTEGWVVVEYTITTTGSVANPVVVNSNPPGLFDEAAVTAISRWRYNPRVIAGEAVERTGVRTEIRFDLAPE